MDLQAFAKQVAGIMPQIFTEMAKKLPGDLTRGEMSFPQMLILGLLSRSNECRMGDMARVMGTTKSAVTGLTDRMIRAGLIERSRSAEDRRVVKIRLTRKGIAAYKKIEKMRLKMTSILFSNITRKERAQYLRILKKLQKNIHIRRGHK